MSVKNYDPADVIVIWNGIPIEGFADGTFVNAERLNPSFNDFSGSDGEVARAKSNDLRGTVTITLMQTSSSNDLLSAAAQLDESTGDGVGPLLIKDNSGNTLISAGSAWIVQVASQEFAREITNREWEFRAAELQIFGGGNDTLG